MPEEENISDTKHIIAILLYGNNIVKVFGFLFALSSFWFSIGYYFGRQGELSEHSIEINNLNLQHSKDLNAEIDRRRSAEDQLNQQKIEDLKTTVTFLEKRIDEKNK